MLSPQSLSGGHLSRAPVAATVGGGAHLLGGWNAAAREEGAQTGSPVRGAIHQRDGYCWEEFLPGGMNLQ